MLNSICTLKTRGRKYEKQAVRTRKDRMSIEGIIEEIRKILKIGKFERFIPTLRKTKKEVKHHENTQF